MLVVKKTKRLDNKKPAQVARKFRISIEDVRELQHGENVELEDALARMLKQWGMIAYVTKFTPPSKSEKAKLDHIVVPDDDVSVDDETQLEEGGE